MHNLLLVDLFKSANQLLQDDPSFDFFELASEVLELLQVSSVAKFHDEVEVVLSPLNVLQLYDLWMVNFGQNCDLVLQILKESWSQLLLLNDLHCENLVSIIFAVAAEDLSELAFTQAFLSD